MEKITNIIQFINTLSAEIPNPEASIGFMPEWYKDAPIFIKNKIDLGEEESNNNGILSKKSNHTIKKCMPVFDAITSGYVLKIAKDITIYQSKTGIEKDEEYRTHFAWESVAAIAAHSVEQVEGYPLSGVHTIAVPKFVNYWVVKTPPGYSCLFITPMHRGLPFTIMPGIVDTDTFNHAVSFPFQMNDKGFEGILEAGTPMAQVIPFKRDEFSMEVYSLIEEYTEKNPNTKINTELFPETYKKEYWHKKFFK